MNLPHEQYQVIARIEEAEKAIRDICSQELDDITIGYKLASDVMSQLSIAKEYAYAVRNELMKEPDEPEENPQ